MQTSRDEIITRLLNLPADISRAEQALYEVQRSLQVAKDDLEDARIALLLGHDSHDGSPLITGRNAEEREAQLAHATRENRNRIRGWERDVARARRELELAQNAFSAARSVARMLGPIEGPASDRIAVALETLAAAKDFEERAAGVGR